MRNITPHLWFDTQAREAAEFYAATFPDSRVTSVTTIPDTPTGDADVVTFELLDQPFMAISAGPLFTFTPAVSFLVSCPTAEEVEAIWERLSEEGTELMPLQSYPFSKLYGWTEDRFGLSWQVMLSTEKPSGQRITPTLMFVGDVSGRAEEAIDFYTSVFPDSKVGRVHRYRPDEEPDGEGTVKHAGFVLAGHQFAAMDSARVHDFGFNEAISFVINCDTQDEIDHYWNSLSAVPEAEQCGWLKDRYGLSWQVIPAALGELLGDPDPAKANRVMQAMLQMKKIDIEALRRAYDGEKVTR